LLFLCLDHFKGKKSNQCLNSGVSQAQNIFFFALDRRSSMMVWVEKRKRNINIPEHEIYGETLLKTKSKIIKIDSVGQVLFERSNRATHISISVKPFKGVRVAVPCAVSFDKAMRFAQSKNKWIKKHIEEMRRREKEYETFSKHLTGINRAEAGKKLVNRLNELSEQHGFSYNKVSVRNQKTRWGSCSSKNNISLNMKLVRLPDEMIDYVLLHELVHTRIKNHGQGFWAELNKLVGDAKAMRKKMNEYKMVLM
jgi:predicted metal-dependent hydrolase